MSLPSDCPDSISQPASENGIRPRLNRFFFAEERPVGLALVRILLSLVLLIPTLHRIFRVRELTRRPGLRPRFGTITGSLTFSQSPRPRSLRDSTPC